MATVFEINDDKSNQVFLTTDWIGLGKKYSSSTLPSLVQLAKDSALTIPNLFLEKATFTMPVLKFLVEISVEDLQRYTLLLEKGSDRLKAAVKLFRKHGEVGS